MARPERRSERARQEILRAAVELCEQLSFANMTIEGIAKRAGVGKQTIYRWWPSKAAVVLEALNSQIGPALDFPDTGDVVADLRTQMTEVVRVLGTKRTAMMFSGVVAAAQADHTAARSLLDEVLSRRIEACKARLRRAQEDGQLRHDVDLDDVVELLYGPIYTRLLLHTAALEPTLVDGLLDLAFHGIRAPAQA